MCMISSEYHDGSTGCPVCKIVDVIHDASTSAIIKLKIKQLRNAIPCTSRAAYRYMHACIHLFVLLIGYVMYHAVCTAKSGTNR